MSYTELNYIQSSQGQYVDTGIVSTSNIDYEIQYAVIGGGDYIYQCIIGSEGYHNAFYPYCLDSGAASGEYIAYSYDSVMWAHLGVDLQGIRTTMKKTKNVFRLSALNSFAKTLQHTSTADFSLTSNMLIFAMSKATPDYCIAKLHYCKIWDHGVLVRDFIPVLDESGIACLYDKVSDAYFYNQGAGSFVAGEITEDGMEYMPIMTDVNAYFDARKNVTETSWGNLTGDINFELFEPTVSKNGVEVSGTETSYGKFSKPWVSGSSRTWYFVFKNLSGVYSNWKAIISNEAATYRCSSIGMDANGYIKFTRPDLIPSTSLGYKCSDWHVVAWVSNGDTKTTKLWIDGTYIGSVGNMQGWADDTYLCRGSTWTTVSNETAFRAIAIADSAHADAEVVTNSNWLYQRYVNEYHQAVVDNVTMLQYIEATGTQYIDLGFPLTESHKVDIKFMVSGNSAIFGSRNHANSNNIGIAHNGGNVVIDFCNGSVETYRIIQAIDGNSAYRVVSGKNGRYIYDADGNLLSSNTTVCNHTITTPGNAYLFNMSYNANGWGIATGRIYYCKIYEDDILIHDLVPVLDAGGVTCLYDKVSEGCYYNKGSGNFIPGPIVAESITQLQYIESIGTQYIDTGFFPTKNTYAEIKYCVLNTDAEAPHILSSNCLYFPLVRFNTTPPNIFASRFGALTTVTREYTPGEIITVKAFLNNEVLVNGEKIADSATIGTKTNTTNLYLLTAGDAIADSRFTGCVRLYYCKIWDGDTLVRDFYPAVSSDGTIGMWDAVTGVLYINAGTGTFVAGQQVYSRGYLIRSRSTIYTVTDATLTALTETEVTASLFQTYGVDELPDAALLLLGLTDPEILYWHDSTDDLPTLTASVTGTPPVPQVVITDAQDMSDPTILGIESVTVEASEDVLWAISFDDGATWKAYDGTQWAVLEQENSGMTAETLQAISVESWAAAVTSDHYRIRFILPNTASYVASLTIHYLNEEVS